MAKLRSVIGSGFSGRIGNVVGARSKGGEYVIRARAEEVNNPNTLRQRVSRLRLKLASQLAAGLAAAIQSGYAFSTNGTKMYPRNMFVAGLIKDYTALTIVPATMQYEVDYGAVKVAKRNGISAVPDCGTPNFETAGQVTIPINKLEYSDVLPAGKMGVVFAVYEPDSNACMVDMMEAPTNASGSITINLPSSWSGATVHVYAFCKWIPETGNEVTTTTEPWKYPAQTGDSVYVGTGSVA